MREGVIPALLVAFAALLAPHSAAAETIEQKAACVAETLRRSPDVHSALLVPSPRSWLIYIDVSVKVAPMESRLYVSKVGDRYYLGHGLQNMGMTGASLDPVKLRCGLLDSSAVNEHANPFGPIPYKPPESQTGIIDLKDFALPHLPK